MSWIYVTEPGAKLAKQGGRYVISRENETICEVPSAVVEGVTLFDSIQISSSVIVDFFGKKYSSDMAVFHRTLFRPAGIHGSSECIAPERTV